MGSLPMPVLIGLGIAAIVLIGYAVLRMRRPRSNEPGQDTAKLGRL